MQLVKHVLEELARFNLEARMNPEIHVDGISPMTECNVTTASNVEYIDELEEEIKDLEADIEQLESDAEDVKSEKQKREDMLNRVMDAADQLKEGNTEAAMEILSEQINENQNH